MPWAIRCGAAVLALLLAVAPLAAQPPDKPFKPGKPDKPGKPGGPGPVGFDPDMIFNAMDRNRDGIVTRDEIPDPRGRERFDEYLRLVHAPNDRLSRDQFLKAFHLRIEQRLREGRKDVYGKPKEILQSLDANFDRRLGKDELQNIPRLAKEIQRWDANRDGFIDEEELKAFTAAVEEEGRGRLGPPPLGRIAASPAPPPAHIAYRAGRLPPGLPDWFTELDSDRDGQVGLYEWKGRAPDEFLRYDRNNDGFITVEEVLFQMNAKPGS
jgi:Ca2+-binding EF-hand superfamily protein